MRANGWAYVYGLAGLAGSLGCGSNSEAEVVDDDQFAIGESDSENTEFALLHDGDSLLLITDVQTGKHAHGYHVYLQIKVTAAEEGLGNLTTKLVEPNAGLVLREQTNSIALTPLEDGGQELVLSDSIQVYVCPSEHAGYAMYGTEMRLNVELDTGGSLFESSVMVTPECPAGDDRCTDNTDTEWPGPPPGCAAP
jgi:hypothetical protein